MKKLANANAHQYRRMVSRSGILLVIFFLFTHASLSGQGYTASLTGTLRDPAGAPVSGAVIQVTQLEKEQPIEVHTNSDGSFNIPGLLPARYGIRVAVSGFDPLAPPDVTLETSQILHLDLQLSLGTAREVITISEDAGIIETESGQLSQTITAREISQMPLNGRNFLTLNLLTPGTVPAAAGSNPQNMNGARADHVGYLLDGIPNLQRRGNEPAVQPSLETVQEFRALANSYAAEYGQQPGILSVALKSGTNDMHASVFDFLRNDALDARGFFDTQTPKLKELYT